MAKRKNKKKRGVKRQIKAEQQTFVKQTRVKGLQMGWPGWSATFGFASVVVSVAHPLWGVTLAVCAWVAAGGERN